MAELSSSSWRGWFAGLFELGQGVQDGTPAFNALGGTPGGSLHLAQHGPDRALPVPKSGCSTAWFSFLSGRSSMMDRSVFRRAQ